MMKGQFWNSFMSPTYIFSAITPIQDGLGSQNSYRVSTEIEFWNSWSFPRKYFRWITGTLKQLKNSILSQVFKNLTYITAIFINWTEHIVYFHEIPGNFSFSKNSSSFQRNKKILLIVQDFQVRRHPDLGPAQKISSHMHIKLNCSLYWPVIYIKKRWQVMGLSPT